MSNYNVAFGELRPSPFDAECQAGVSTTVKATGTESALIMSVGPVVNLVYPTAEALRTHVKRQHGLPADRFARLYVVETNGCWRWTGALTTQGYGHFCVRNVYYQAHVISYILHVGPPPAGLEPDHLCRNRWCVNPQDIEWVTHAVNMQRSARAVLSQEQVDAIRRAGKSAGIRAMARAYGVNHSTISRIVAGLTWPEPASAEVAA